MLQGELTFHRAPDLQAHVCLVYSTNVRLLLFYFAYSYFLTSDGYWAKYKIVMTLHAFIHHRILCPEFEVCIGGELKKLVRGSLRPFYVKGISERFADSGGLLCISHQSPKPIFLSDLCK